MLVAIYRKILRRNKQGKAPRCDALLGALVRVVRLERTVSWSQTRRDTNFAIPGYLLFSMIPRRTVKIKFFLSVVIPVVKAAFAPPSATGESPANAGVARLCGVSPYPVPDTATALPNQARYQLRYTRIKICRPHPGGISTIPAFFLACKGKICLGAFCIPGAFPPPPDYSPRAAFRASTRSVFSQATPRSSRPIWP